MLALIDSLPTAIVFIENGSIVNWNPAAASLYGYAAHEALGRSFVELLIDHTDVALAGEILRDAVGRGRWEGNFRVIRRDGASLVSSFVVASVIDPSDREVVAWVATDAVDQHLAEQERDVLLSAQHAARQELEATLGVFEALLECAPIGIAVLDLELSCTHANSTFASMIASDRAPVGQYIDDVATLPAEVAADLRRVVTTGRSLTDRKVELKAGAGRASTRVISANYFPIFAGPNRPAGAGLTWSDVTAARVAEGERAELAQRADDAHRRLAVLASASSVLMTTTDVDALLDRLARVLAPSAADWCVIELIGRTGLIDHVAVSHADRDRARLVRDSLVGTPADASPQSPVAEVRRTGQARLLTSADLARAWDPLESTCRHASLSIL